MTHVTTQRSFQVLMLTSLVLLGTLAASAQIGGFRRTASEAFSGRVVLINRLKNYPPGRRVGAVSVRSPLATAWQKARPVLIDTAIRMLNERNIGGGVRTSRNALALAETGDLFIGTDGAGFTLRYVLAGNNLTTSLRHPGPSPSGTDPRLSVNFDIEVSINVDRTGSGGITAGPARLKLNVSRPTGANLTGDMVVAANNLAKFLAGKDFIGEGLAAVNSSDFALSTPVNFELNRMLEGLTSQKIIVSTVLKVNQAGALKGKNELNLILENDNGGPIVN